MLAFPPFFAPFPNIDGISPLCQFHLVDEHTRHGSLIETSLVKVLRRDYHHDDNVNKNALKYQEIKSALKYQEI